MREGKKWTREELDYLYDSWGQISKGVIYPRSEFRASC